MNKFKVGKMYRVLPGVTQIVEIVSRTDKTVYIKLYRGNEYSLIYLIVEGRVKIRRTGDNSEYIIPSNKKNHVGILPSCYASQEVEVNI